MEVKRNRTSKRRQRWEINSFLFALWTEKSSFSIGSVYLYIIVIACFNGSRWKSLEGHKSSYVHCWTESWIFFHPVVLIFHILYTQPLLFRPHASNNDKGFFFLFFLFFLLIESSWSLILFGIHNSYGRCSCLRIIITLYVYICVCVV